MSDGENHAQSLQKAIDDAKAMLASQPHVETYKVLSQLYHLAGRYGLAASTLIEAYEAFDDENLCEFIGAYLANDGQDEASVPWLEKALVLDKDNLNANTALACAYGRMGQNELARVFGDKSLTLRHEQALRYRPNSSLKISRKEEAKEPEGDYIISFSLFGDERLYLDGAVENVIAARTLFPGWQVRFYVDNSVPADYVIRLASEGADIVQMPEQEKPYEGLFWRFLVAADPNVARFLVRDADSVLSLRDRHMVDAWIKSSKAFHVVRDGFTHTSLILAGLWAGKGGLLPNIDQKIQQWVGEQEPSPSWDQTFLGYEIWPMIYKHVAIHDRCFTAFHAKKLPDLHEPAARYLGRKDMLLESNMVKIGGFASNNVVQSEGGSGHSVKVIVCPDPLTAMKIETSLAQNGGRVWREGLMDGTMGMIFARYGFNREIQAFWRQALAGQHVTGHRDESQPVMVSGFGLQAGLLDCLMTQTELNFDVTIVTPTAEMVAENIMAWLEAMQQPALQALGLDFDAKAKIVTPEPLNKYGLPGLSLWLAAETLSRLSYYQLKCDAFDHINMKIIDYHDDADHKVIQSLLPNWDHITAAEIDGLPQLSDENRAALHEIMKGTNFSAKEMGELFAKQGRKLG